MENDIKNKIERLDSKIIDFLDNDTVLIKCNICSAIKKMKIKSLIKTKSKTLHNIFCVKYYNNLIKDELGEEALKKFRNLYRISKERCTNPNSKDYKKYANKFKYNDYIDYYNDLYPKFKDAISVYKIEDLSIDRIDNNKGYEIGNCRFVPMYINLQNKDCVKPIIAKNINTGLILETASIGEMYSKHPYYFSSASVIHRALINNRLYKKEWKFDYKL